MFTRIPLLLALALAVAVPSHAAVADVRFVDPGKFSDVGRDSVHSGRDAYLEMLKRHLVERASRALPAEQRLEVSITDVDMAGTFEPWVTPARDVRVIKDIYPPRIDLRFILTAADGTVLSQGERELRDPAFLMSAGNSSSDPLRFEKALLDQWLREEFGARRR